MFYLYEFCLKNMWNRPLLEGLFEVQRLLTTRKRDGVSKIDI
jgi:hypothetical protein